ncbi:MAG: hypothetical protein ACRD2F_14895 [Terriglobales bacterium]
MRLADRIRQFAAEHYVGPARRQGRRELRIRSGDLHRTMGLRARVPAVCSALRSGQFLAANGLQLTAEEGPPSGQGSNTGFAYRLDGAPQGTGFAEQFASLRGIARKTFAELGGGETWLRAERQAFERGVRRRERGAGRRA